MTQAALNLKIVEQDGAPPSADRPITEHDVAIARRVLERMTPPLAVLQLPWPPSVNDYKVPRWGAKGSWYLTKRATRFKRDVAMISPKLRLSGELRVDVTLHPPTRAKRDVDNYVKCVFDALQDAEVFLDDSQIAEFSARRAGIVKGGMVKVEICPYQEC